MFPFLVILNPIPQEASIQPTEGELEPVDAPVSVPRPSWDLKDRRGVKVGELIEFVRIPGIRLSKSIGVRSIDQIKAEADDHFDPEVTQDYRFPMYPLQPRDEQFQLRGPGRRPGALVTWLLVWEVINALAEWSEASNAWREAWTFEVVDNNGNALAFGYRGQRINDRINNGMDDGIIIA